MALDGTTATINWYSYFLKSSWFFSCSSFPVQGLISASFFIYLFIVGVPKTIEKPSWKKVNKKNVPEMSRRVSTIEDQLLLWIHIFVNPICPGLQSPSIGLNWIKLWIDIITFFIVIFPASTKQISFRFHEKHTRGRSKSILLSWNLYKYVIKCLYGLRTSVINYIRFSYTTLSTFWSIQLKLNKLYFYATSSKVRLFFTPHFSDILYSKHLKRSQMVQKIMLKTRGNHFLCADHM